MTVKRRLAISNLLMILVPVVITLAISLGCLGVVWLSLTHGQGLGFEGQKDFRFGSQSLGQVVEEALEKDPAKSRKALAALSATLDEQAVALRVWAEGQPFYAHGDAAPQDVALLQAMDDLGGEGTITTGGRAVYAHRAAVEGTQYRIYLFATQGEVNTDALKHTLTLVAVILGATVVAAIVATNRFLVRFVFRHIQNPLDLLAHGVEEIGKGNLDYRIRYEGSDEFAGICRQFNNMAAHLQDSVTETIHQEESRKELMAGISHDLRSPLTSILAYVEGLQEGVAKTPEKTAEYLAIIHDKTRQIQALVSQLFLYTKLDLAAYPIHPVCLDLTGWLTRLAEGPGRDFAQRGLAVTLAQPLPQVTAWADPGELERVVLNCLDNSAKYKTKPEGQMTLALTDLGERVRLTLADDGPGVPPAELRKLFAPFYRGDKARQDPTQGSGLGLAIAAKAVGRMDGRIWTAASDPTGLTICIELAKEDPHHGEDLDH